MAFMTHFESDEQETARLAAAPEGSLAHYWSTLPILSRYQHEGQIVEIPLHPTSGGRLIAVLAEHRPIVHPEGQARQAPWQRDGSWNCIVVASSIDSYPVGGNRISVPDAQLRRATVLAPADLLSLAVGDLLPF